MSHFLPNGDVSLTAEDTADLLRMAQGMAVAFERPRASEAFKRVNRLWLAGFERMAAEGPTVLRLRPQPTPAQIRATAKWAELESMLRKAATVSFHASKRRTAKLQRTPLWADMDAIRAFYVEAQRITQETGEPHHVDHIVPLQGRFVSGLHVQNNLQIIPGSENSKKRNHFEVEA